MSNTRTICLSLPFHNQAIKLDVSCHNCLNSIISATLSEYFGYGLRLLLTPEGHPPLDSH